ncbi:hypothetical protein ARSQ2_01678 [Arsenophonus endosymbiont of Bemisia tabaci Q2]|nr:hypothetical protein ARSQ2_01678 [Arsenophonus endosymbiont of Bemisia tabaci Q2]
MKVEPDGYPWADSRLFPGKVNGVLVSRTEEIKEEQMLSALYWVQRCLLSDYLISISAMLMYGSPGAFISAFLNSNMIYDLSQETEYFPINSIDAAYGGSSGLYRQTHPLTLLQMQKKSARMRHRYFFLTQYGVIKIKSLSYKEQLTPLNAAYSLLFKFLAL